MILEIIATSMLIVGYVILFFGMSLMLLSIFNFTRTRRYKLDPNYEPKISLIVPAHNEEKVIERTIKRFIETHYPKEKKEMIIVNDGSTDKTGYIAAKYAGRIINSRNKKTTNDPKKDLNIVLINRPTGGNGKSFAVNDGKSHAQGEFLFFIDADVQLNTDTFGRVASHFADKSVDVLTGYVKVNEEKGIWNGFIDFEYVLGQKILRRGFNSLGVHYVIPGGFAVFRKTLLDTVGDYHHDTLAEDTDLTWRIITETNARINFDPSIHVIADEPATLIALWNQHVRWARGNMEVTWKHKHKVGKRRYGRGATWVYPFWLSSMVLPFAFMISATGFILTALITGGEFPNVLRFLGIILASFFFTSWLVATVINDGKSWLEGLLTPGVPVLVSIAAIFYSNTGIVGILDTLTHSQIGTIFGFVMGIWIFISIAGTYLCLFLARKGQTKIADMLQLLVFGYWMFLVVTILQAYYEELVRSEQKWIRTAR